MVADKKMNIFDWIKMEILYWEKSIHYDAYNVTSNFKECLSLSHLHGRYLFPLEIIMENQYLALNWKVSPGQKILNVKTFVCLPFQLYELNKYPCKIISFCSIYYILVVIDYNSNKISL